MKRKYTNMTKSDLIKKIEYLEAEKKNRDKENIPNEVEELNQLLHIKDVQIENQKIELLEKQIQLETSRDKYADLHDFASTGYTTLNSNGVIEEINLTGASMLGIEVQCAAGIPFINFLIKDETHKFLAFIRKCRNSGRICAEEFTLTNKKESIFFVQLIMLSYQDYRTRKISFRVSISDISERKKAEKSLQESEERFRLMADASPAMIWMTNADNRLVYMNKAKLGFLGKTLEELTNNGWMDTRHPEDKDKFIAELSKAANERKNFSIEIRVINKMGEYRWLLEAAAPRFLADGTFIGFIGSGMDVTERKISRIKLEKSLKEKEVLLKEIHHRVKNNLQVISSLLNLQRNYINSMEMLNIFKSSQSRISAMAILHEKLYGSKNLSNIDIRDYIISVSKSLLDTYRDSTKDVKIYFEIEEMQLDLDISINFGLIINELVSNALKYAFPGKSDGRIKIALNKLNGTDILLQVSDNGIGLPENFEMIRNKSLGLELVSNIVDQIQGKLEISKNGETKFIITVKQYALA